MRTLTLVVQCHSIGKGVYTPNVVGFMLPVSIRSTLGCNLNGRGVGEPTSQSVANVAIDDIATVCTLWIMFLPRLVG